MQLAFMSNIRLVHRVAEIEWSFDDIVTLVAMGDISLQLGYLRVCIKVMNPGDLRCGTLHRIIPDSARLKF